MNTNDYAPIETIDPGEDAAAPAQTADAYRMARALSDRYANQCGVDKDDNWKIYGQDYIDDVRAMLEGAEHE